MSDLEGRLLIGDCRERLRDLPEASIDAVVTDPPYELGFMGKAWDAAGVAYDVGLWAEVLRVLKPGGHLLAFGGTRTYHRMACAIEDAGFEIRDSIHWLYGSGFPKSLDVSKAIDKVNGAEREVVGTKTSVNGGGTSYELRQGPRVEVDANITAPATDAARQWSGWGTALKPAHEPIVVARKPLVGTVAATVLEHGTGALNIDGARVGYQSDADLQTTQQKNPGTDDLVTSIVYGANRPQQSVNTSGRWPANLVFTHAADCGDECAEGCPVAELDGQSAEASRFFTVTEWADLDDLAPFIYIPKPSKSERNAGLDGLEERNKYKAGGVGGTGGMRDVDKAVNATPVANYHPTVKPVALMRWLVRLVTPPGGIVLDPFLGSGTTAMAALLEGFDWRGIEMTDDYLPIIEGRIKRAGQAARINAMCELRCDAPV